MKFTFPPETRVLDGYTIKRAIYRGGFGEVYYALSDAGREVALKLLHHNTEIELRGVQQCLNLSHPHLVTIFDIREDAEGDHWIIMEYVGGETLDAAIRRHPAGMPMEQIRRWLPGLTAGVAFLHSRGLVHRDLKPANVFSADGIVKVGDVGLSKFITPSRRSAQTQSVGTVYYMAPEVAKGRYGKEVDIYALGVMVYEMLTGRVPFEGESAGEILLKHLTEAPDLSQLPPRLKPVVGRAMAKDPSQRFASVEEFARAFDAAVLGKSVTGDDSRREPFDPRLKPALAEPPVTVTAPVGGASPPPAPRDQRSAPAEASATVSREQRTGWQRLIPSDQGWGWIIGLGVLFMVVSLKSSFEPLPALCAGLLFGYLSYVLRQFFARRTGPGGQNEPGQPQTSAAVEGPFAEQPLRRRMLPTSRGWGMILGFGLLFMLGTRTSGNEALVYLAMGTGCGYLLYSTPRISLRREWPFETVTSVAAMASTPPGAKPVGAMGSPPRPLAAAPGFRPLALTPLAPRTRLAHWLTTATLATFLTAGLTTSVALLAPSLLSLQPGGALAPEVIAQFSLTALLATWLVSAVVKLTEGHDRRRGNNGTEGLRRLGLAAAGAITGAAAWWLGDFLQVDAGQLFAGQLTDGMLESLGERPLVAVANGRPVPTLLGYLVFFSGLFGLRAWWRQIELQRPERFRALSVLLTVAIAWLWSHVFLFPQTWAMLWAAVISATVQLASPWSLGPRGPRPVFRR